jgi:hypothetical protein
MQNVFDLFREDIAELKSDKTVPFKSAAGFFESAAVLDNAA